MYPIDPSTQLELLRERQQWTKEKPRVAGYYWLRGWAKAMFDPEMVYVSENCVRFTPWGSDCDWKVDQADGEWSGPLQPPC